MFRPLFIGAAFAVSVSAFAADFTLDNFTIGQTAPSNITHPLLGQRSMETHYNFSEPGTSTVSLFTNSNKLNFNVDSVNGGYGNVQYIGSQFGGYLNLGAYQYIKLDVDKVSGHVDLSLLLKSVDGFGDPYEAYYSGIHLTSANNGSTVGFDLTHPNTPVPHFDRSRLYIAVLTISSGAGTGSAGADFTSFYASPVAVPEPASMAALGAGLAVLLRRRKRA